jgi:CRISPR/Cas system CSM-associated protein Csm2 small subunit
MHHKKLEFLDNNNNNESEDGKLPAKPTTLVTNLPEKVISGSVEYNDHTDTSTITYNLHDRHNSRKQKIYKNLSHSEITLASQRVKTDIYRQTKIIDEEGAVRMTHEIMQKLSIDQGSIAKAENIKSLIKDVLGYSRLYSNQMLREKLRGTYFFVIK